MNRQRYSQDRIVELLSEVELRLAQGEPLSLVCKSLDVSRSSYRRWRRKYGESAVEHAAAVASGSKGQTADADPASSEGVLAGEAKAKSKGKAVSISKEAEKLLDAANDASDPARYAWLAFLGLLAYLLVTLGGVSHKDLLLDSPVKLPIINVDIPLFSFFQYAPLLLLLVYLSLLIQHVILARKYRKFTAAIAPYEKEALTDHPTRELVPSYVVSQLLAGPKYNLLVRSLMRLMVFVTFALLPIVTLLYFQVKFLPYHEIWITYWHRIAVLLGLVLLFAVLPIIHLRPRKREVKIGPPEMPWQESPLGIVIGSAFAVLVLGFSWMIATIPEEWVERQLLGFVTPNLWEQRPEQLLNPLVRAAYEPIAQLDEPEVPPLSGRVQGRLLPWLLSHRVLVVEDTDLVPDEDNSHREVSIVLRGRDLRFALLNRSDLQRADLTEANLRGAGMWETRLEGALLERTRLQNAQLLSANLEGAQLRKAQLQAAKLYNANLHGADLTEANLQLAYLASAQLPGAVLLEARLQGADLNNADLRATILTAANLQGADLVNANLQGALLRSAELQGANLTSARLQGSDLTGAQVWGACFSDDLTDQSPLPSGIAELDEKPLSKRGRLALAGIIATNPNMEFLRDSVERLDEIRRGDPPACRNKSVSGVKQLPGYDIRELDKSSVTELASFLVDMACGDDTGYIALSVASRALSDSDVPEQKLYARLLARELLGASCEGAKILTKERGMELQEFLSRPE